MLNESSLFLGKFGAFLAKLTYFAQSWRILGKVGVFCANLAHFWANLTHLESPIVIKDSTNL